MAKRKANVRHRARSASDKSGVKPRKRSLLGRLVRFLVSPLVRRLIILVAIVAILFWQWDNLVAWANGVAESTVGLFGWGLILIAITVIIIIGMIWRRQLSALAHRWRLYQWNKWLGAIAFILTIWGILALFKLGGSFGLAIIGQDIVDYPVWASLLRLLGLAVLGVILVAPVACFRLVASLFSWLGRLFKMPSRPPRPTTEEPQLPLRPPTYTRPITAEKIIPPPVMVPPEIPKREPETGAATPVSTPTQAQQELRQVAQEVWKKYGESPALITVDGWRLPPIDILDRAPEVEFGQADNVQRARLIEEALASYGVEAKVVQINAGPTVTQFGVEPGWDRKMKEIKERDKDGNVKVRLEEVSKTRVKVDRITSLANDLALALAAPSIRIEAPVPGKSVVGIEVPNTISGLVSLRGVIETSAFQKIVGKSKLCLALGKGAGGEAIAADLSRMPHLLIAGATGSGKTVCLNSIIC